MALRDYRIVFRAADKTPEATLCINEAKGLFAVYPQNLSDGDTIQADYDSAPPALRDKFYLSTPNQELFMAEVI